MPGHDEKRRLQKGYKAKAIIVFAVLASFIKTWFSSVDLFMLCERQFINTHQKSSTKFLKHFQPRRFLPDFSYFDRWGLLCKLERKINGLNVLDSDDIKTRSFYLIDYDRLNPQQVMSITR